jgi:hypothetical protein
LELKLAGMHVVFGSVEETGDLLVERINLRVPAKKITGSILALFSPKPANWQLYILHFGATRGFARDALTNLAGLYLALEFFKYQQVISNAQFIVAAYVLARSS